MIYVTKPYLPNIKKYESYLEKIYKKRWLTNDGPLVKELNARLCDYLGVNNLVLVANGTLALMLAYKLLNISSNVITTPFTFVATSSALLWNDIKPVFSDIDPGTFNIDPLGISEKIDKDIEAIIPVHVFGNACDIKTIKEIANNNDLKTIYDASHAFAVKYKGENILNYGDISTISFHATKLFHTVEGGALVINNDSLYEQAKSMVDFGYDSNNVINQVGINAKMSEFHAAMGLAVLDDIDLIIDKRRNISELYNKELKDYFQLQRQNNDSTENYSYFPVIFNTEIELKSKLNKLNNNNIFPRRYFSPSLDQLPFSNNDEAMNVSRDISNKILCLPIYDDLDLSDVAKIINILKQA